MERTPEWSNAWLNAWAEIGMRAYAYLMLVYLREGIIISLAGVDEIDARVKQLEELVERIGARE